MWETPAELRGLVEDARRLLIRLQRADSPWPKSDYWAGLLKESLRIYDQAFGVDARYMAALGVAAVVEDFTSFSRRRFGRYDGPNPEVVRRLAWGEEASPDPNSAFMRLWQRLKEVVGRQGRSS